MVNCNDLRADILMMVEGGVNTPEAIATELGLPEDLVRTHLHDLEQDGEITQDHWGYSPGEAKNDDRASE